MFRMEIKTGGAAFRSDSQTNRDGDFVLDPTACEVRRILSEVRTQLAYGNTSGKIRDINGNAVGSWVYE